VEDADGADPRHSSFRLEVAISIGYQRRRTTLAGKWEGPLVTAVLLVASIAIVAFIVLQVFRWV